MPCSIVTISFDSQSEKQLQQVGEEVQQRQAKCLEVKSICLIKCDAILYSTVYVCMHVQLEEKVDSLTKKLADSERMVELMKSSNRELNATIVSQLAVA